MNIASSCFAITGKMITKQLDLNGRHGLTRKFD